MKHPELRRQHAALKSLIRRAGHDPSTRNLEMLGHWGRYLCVLTAGFVENTVREIFSAYIGKTAQTQTAGFAKGRIGEVQNPRAGRLVEIATAFDKSWGQQLESFLDDNFRKEAINTIMTNRHLIAHGKNSDITIARVDQYLSRIVEVADHLEQQCGL